MKIWGGYLKVLMAKFKPWTWDEYWELDAIELKMHENATEKIHQFKKKDLQVLDSREKQN